MEKTLFIINPASARGTTLRFWSRFRREIVELGVAFDEQFTARANEAAEITSQAIRSGVERVIAVGGDGSLNDIVNGYLDHKGVPVNENAAIGLLPSGTGSDFCRSLGVSKRNWVRALIAPRIRLVDAGRASFRGIDGREVTRFFISEASFGLGADVSSKVNRWRSALPKWIGAKPRFAGAALAALKRYQNRPVSLGLDGNQRIQISSNLIVVANSPFVGGGMMLAPDAKLDDGEFEVIATDGATRLDVIKELPRIYRGTHLKNPRVLAFRAREVSVESAGPMPIDLDGEMLGFTPARLSVLTGVVRLTLPPRDL